MKKKYSKNFNRDFNFYKKNIKYFTFFGNYPPKVKYDELGKDAKRCFYIFDSTGKIIPTSEPKLLQDLIICKKSINFHIKMWAEGFAECTLLYSDIENIKEKYQCPKWVITAIENQGNRIRKKSLLYKHIINSIG